MADVLSILIGIIVVLCGLGYLVFCIATFVVVVFDYLPGHKDRTFTKMLIFLGLILGLAFTLYGVGAGCYTSEDIAVVIRPEGFAITVGIGAVMWLWMFRGSIYDKFSKKKLEKKEQKKQVSSYEDNLKKSIKEYTNNYRRY